ncbi:VOC family protein [Niallia sp. FSL R7-0271]|uniref:VOC family protein n=1 Tax=Niallia sp. FSL R7-0271 TaxID=2921678 RepID=UPI0030FD1575
MEIKSLTLHSNNLVETKMFYTKTLGFTLVDEDDNNFQIMVGSSKLTFTNQSASNNPFYHFAFNIPANKFSEEKQWTKERLNLLTENGEDEVDFSHLSAHAFYFYDPSGNIVEFIARYGINSNSNLPFTSESILNISEIGLVVEDVMQTGQEMINNGIFERDNNSISDKYLNFMGKKHKGIFVILAQPDRKWLFSEKYSAIFPLEIVLDNNKILIVNTKNEFLIKE